MGTLPANTLSGLRIEPALPPKGGVTANLPIEVLGFEPQAFAKSC